jgi:hypothetical protein
MTSLSSVSRISVTSVVLAAVLSLSACVTPAPKPAVVPPVKAAEVGELYPNSGILKGYLSPARLPDCLALLPAPPAEGSAALAADTARNGLPESHHAVAADHGGRLSGDVQSEEPVQAGQTLRCAECTYLHAAGRGVFG